MHFDTHWPLWVEWLLGGGGGQGGNGGGGGGGQESGNQKLTLNFDSYTVRN